MAPKILCVAEKPSIAKSVANHLSGGHVHAVSSREIHLLLGYISFSLSVMFQAINMLRITNSILRLVHHGEIALLPWPACLVILPAMTFQPNIRNGRSLLVESFSMLPSSPGLPRSVVPMQLTNISSDQGAQDKEPIARNITQQARYSKALLIWTDCDREGEHIGSEVRQAAVEGKPGIEVKRAIFSNTERA